MKKSRASFKSKVIRPSTSIETVSRPADYIRLFSTSRPVLHIDTEIDSAVLPGKEVNAIEKQKSCIAEENALAKEKDETEEALLSIDTENMKENEDNDEALDDEFPDEPHTSSGVSASLHILTGRPESYSSSKSDENIACYASDKSIATDKSVGNCEQKETIPVYRRRYLYIEREHYQLSIINHKVNI